MEHYFAKDGNYGEASGIAVLPTDKWQESDWDEIESAGDSERTAKAIEIAKRYEGQ